MQNVPPRREAPAYPIASVDHALRLVQLLRDGGPVRVADAAAELGVAQSTAHRLLAMLVFRDFAIQDEERRYHPGAAIGQAPIAQEWSRRLRSLARPHLDELSRAVGETSNLMIRVGARVRFLLTVEASEGAAIGDRQGVILPAIYTAGGRAMLADLPDRSLELLLGGSRASRSGDALSAGERGRLRAELASVRRLGYARNFDDTELGLSAVAAAVRDASGRVAAAVALAARSSRVGRVQSRESIDRLLVCRDRVQSALAEAGVRSLEEERPEL